MAKLFANSADLIKRRILKRRIWVCTVCQLPFQGSPDYNGLKGDKFGDMRGFLVVPESLFKWGLLLKARICSLSFLLESPTIRREANHFMKE